MTLQDHGVPAAPRRAFISAGAGPQSGWFKISDLRFTEWVIGGFTVDSLVLSSFKTSKRAFDLGLLARHSTLNAESKIHLIPLNP
jgi:hypothetical protein